MSMNYRLADMLTQIRNGQAARLSEVRVQASKFLGSVLEVLKNEGYIEDYKREETSKGKAEFVIALRYQDGEMAIREVVCISKPGRRVYSKIENLPKQFNGLGISILSTSRGVMSDYDARKAGVGGEVLCSVF
jgi:small subunit ribosomal protein S8